MKQVLQLTVLQVDLPDPPVEIKLEISHLKITLLLMLAKKLGGTLTNIYIFLLVNQSINFLLLLWLTLIS